MSSEKKREEREGVFHFSRGSEWVRVDKEKSEVAHKKYMQSYIFKRMNWQKIALSLFGENKGNSKSISILFQSVGQPFRGSLLH